MMGSPCHGAYLCTDWLLTVPLSLLVILVATFRSHAMADTYKSADVGGAGYRRLRCA